VKLLEDVKRDEELSERVRKEKMNYWKSAEGDDE
jgi:hypothetical protein